jgi:hypothetical protein
LEYPDGVLIEAHRGEYQKAIEDTNELLKLENCVIFEAAFAFNNLEKNLKLSEPSSLA